MNARLCSIPSALLVAVLLSACGGGETAAKSNSVKKKIESAHGLMSGLAPGAMSFDAFYRSDCTPVTVDGETAYAIGQIKFEKTRTLPNMRTIQNPFEQTVVVYGDPSCAMGAIRTYEFGTYLLNDARNRLTRTKQLSAKVTPLIDAISDAFNRDQYCGYRDWSRNVDKDLTGALCIRQPNDVAVINSLDAKDEAIEVIDCDDWSNPTDETCQVFTYRKN